MRLSGGKTRVGEGRSLGWAASGWKGAGTENDIAATCFAILFLRRATRPLKIATKK